MTRCETCTVGCGDFHSLILGDVAYNQNEMNQNRTWWTGILGPDSAIWTVTSFFKDLELHSISKFSAALRMGIGWFGLLTTFRIFHTEFPALALSRLVHSAQTAVPRAKKSVAFGRQSLLKKLQIFTNLKCSLWMVDLIHVSMSLTVTSRQLWMKLWSELHRFRKTNLQHFTNQTSFVPVMADRADQPDRRSRCYNDDRNETMFCLSAMFLCVAILEHCMCMRTSRWLLSLWEQPSELSKKRRNQVGTA